MLQNMSTADNEDIVSICANCGKEGDGVNNSCNKCKIVKYCNASCKKKHRKKHKKQCEEYVKKAAERAAELHDEELFKQPPPEEDCPICFLRMPTLYTGKKYMTCCGKVICSGCIHAPVYDNEGNIVAEKICPFCRTPDPIIEEEANERDRKLMEANDPIAIFSIGCDYQEGENGYSQDYTKALELFHRAAELGFTEAYCSIGNVYENGRGVEIDKKKAVNYYEIAAIKGSEIARHNLGNNEIRANNKDRALKHHMIAVRSGYNKSLEKIKELYANGHASKEDYTKALKLYQTYLGEIKSAQRDKAAAADNRYRYY